MVEGQGHIGCMIRREGSRCRVRDMAGGRGVWVKGQGQGWRVSANLEKNGEGFRVMEQRWSVRGKGGGSGTGLVGQGQGWMVRKKGGGSWLEGKGQGWLQWSGTLVEGYKNKMCGGVDQIDSLRYKVKSNILGHVV